MGAPVGVGWAPSEGSRGGSTHVFIDGVGVAEEATPPWALFIPILPFPILRRPFELAPSSVLWLRGAQIGTLKTTHCGSGVWTLSLLWFPREQVEKTCQLQGLEAQAGQLVSSGPCSALGPGGCDSGQALLPAGSPHPAPGNTLP